jgi:hypothetical protein
MAVDGGTLAVIKAAIDRGRELGLGHIGHPHGGALLVQA